MFSQVPKTSDIEKHSIHEETIGDLEHFALLWDFISFFEHLVFDLRPDVVSSVNELSAGSSRPMYGTAPTK